ncbi:hypothetical protein ACFQ1M_10365 [Sungkyunkwania multivorans]|uniref:Uncharacterized protein n=1 Tax=Sungkyunkwania multivorans TaxID=1173618 RepID=A0ABW3D0W0_9FLAO
MKFYFFIPFLISFYLTTAQETYYPPKLLIEISSNIQVGVKTQGQTKTYLNYKIENNQNFSSSNTNTFSNSYIRDVTKERQRKTNEDYYKSRPKPSSLLGGIAKAFSGDPSGLLDFGGNVLDHMMTPKYRVYETSTYKTTEKFERTNTTTNTSSTDVKNQLVQQITQESTVDANAGFIRFSLRIFNDAQKGIRIKNPQFVLYFLMPNGSREIISFQNATAGDGQVHWLPAKNYKDFEVNVENLDVQRLFSNYLNSEEIEVNLNNLEVEVSGQSYFAGELEESHEDNGVRVKYYNGQDTKEFFALIGDARPTAAELIKDYLKEQQLEFYPVEDDTSIVDAIKKISVNENVQSDKKLNQISGQELIDWRKWVVTVYDQNNVIIPFSVSDRLQPGYKISLSYFAAKDLMGVHYRPVIYEKKGIVFTADGQFQLNVDLKKDDELVIDNVKLRKLYTDKVKYAIAPVQIAANDPLVAGLPIRKTEAQMFLDQQRSMESVYTVPATGQPFSFNFNNTNGQNLKFYWFRPTQVVRQEFFKPEDFVFLRWFKGNPSIDNMIGQVSKEAQQTFIESLIVRHIYNAFDPELKIAKPANFGLVKGGGHVTINGNNNSPELATMISYLTSENGLEKIRDSIKNAKTIHYKVPKNISASSNVWKSSMARNRYYSFLSSAKNNLPTSATYRSLSTGRHAMRLSITLDTRTGNTAPWSTGMLGGPPMGIGSSFGFGNLQNPEKSYSIETLTKLNDQQPDIHPIYGNTASLGQQETTLNGNKELFEISFDVKVVRTK